MITCYFLDWIEPPVAPWSDAVTREFDVTFTGHPKQYERRFPSSAHVWLRSDGFFIFSLEFPKREKDIAERLTGFDPFAIDVASFASEFIRNGVIENRANVGFDQSLRYSFRSIMVKPIKISKQLVDLNPDQLLEKLKDDDFLRKLPAKIRENENGFFSNEDNVSAILLLRRHFGRCYDKALAIRHNFKNRKIVVPIWWSRVDGKWQNKKSVKFDYYGIKHIAVVWLLWSPILAWNTIRTLPAPISDSVDGTVQKFGAKFWEVVYSFIFGGSGNPKGSIENLALAISEVVFWVMGLGVFPAVVIAWFLVIYEKRRKTIMAYDKAIGVLQTGNYYHAILKRIMTFGKPRAKASAGEIPTDFGLLITRLEEYKRIELEKEASNRRLIYGIGIFGALAFGTIINLPEYLLMFLNSEHVKDWLDVFTLAPTRRN